MVVSVLALSSGNNLLYILVSLLVATLIVSLFISRLILGRIDLRLRYPERVRVGETVAIDVTVQNRRRLFPVLSLVVRLIEQPPGSGKRERFDQGYLPLLPRRTEARLTAERRFRHRGIWRTSSIRLETRSPFGLFEQRRSMVIVGEMRVHPPVRALPVPDILLNAIGYQESPRRGSDGDLYSIRDSPGTDPHHSIDWKATARSGHLMVREYTAEDDRRVIILFDYSGAGDSTTLREAGVILVASLADRLLGAGVLVRLETSTRTIPFGSGPEQRRAVFDLLADLPFPGRAAAAPLWIGPVWTERLTRWWEHFTGRSCHRNPIEAALAADWSRVESGYAGSVLLVVPTRDRLAGAEYDQRIRVVCLDELPAEFIEDTEKRQGEVADVG